MTATINPTMANHTIDLNLNHSPSKMGKMAGSHQITQIQTEKVMDRKGANFSIIEKLKAIGNQGMQFIKSGFEKLKTSLLTSSSRKITPIPADGIRSGSEEEMRSALAIAKAIALMGLAMLVGIVALIVHFCK
jgi:hypothetical protein